MNHCIREYPHMPEINKLLMPDLAVLDLIEVPRDNLAFIVMQEWSAQLVADTPCNLGLCLSALRQCIEVSLEPAFLFAPRRSANLFLQHIAFMHAQHIAHLDVSLRNILTDYRGHYACIDYELSTRFDGVANPRISNARGTEIPPELERGQCSDPYKVDVYALGVLLLRAIEVSNHMPLLSGLSLIARQLTGYDVPELHSLVKPMLSHRFKQRPTAQQVLISYNAMVARIHPSRLRLLPQHS